MLKYWIDLQQNQNPLKKDLLPHLRELASQERFGVVFVQFMKNEMNDIAEMLLTNNLTNIFAKFERLQLVYIRVLECPAGKLMDCLLQLAG